MSASQPTSQLPVCPTKVPQRYLFNPMSALLASVGSASASWPSVSPTLASSSSASAFQGSALSLWHFLCLPDMYSRPSTELPLAATDHQLYFSANLAHKIKFLINLVYLSLTLKPPLILFLLSLQRPKLSPQSKAKIRFGSIFLSYNLLTQN